MFQKVWQSEIIRESWHESTVIQLFKGRGSQSDLDNIRHIHDRDQYSKIFGQMVISAAKSTLFENLSKFQIACKPGHRPSEHLYVFKSVFAKYQQDKKGLLIKSYDLKKFFDMEDIFDILNQIYASNVKGKVYRLIYQMNKNIRIKVKTPVGITQSADTGPGAAQGSVDAAVISSVSIGNDVSVTFAEADGKQEVSYESVDLSPLIFIDDIFRMTDTVESAQYANKLMELIIGRKGLEFNQDKSMFVIMGNKKERKALKAQYTFDAMKT